MRHLFILLPGLLLALSASSQGITITGGAWLLMDSSAQLVLNNGGMVNNGYFIAGRGTVAFTGDAGNPAIRGNTVSFNDVIINATGNEVQLRTNIVVNGTIAMKSGLLQLNQYRLNLGNSGTISGETNHSYITAADGGTISRTTVLNAPKAINPGNIGIEITSDANLGNTEVVRGHRQQTTAAGGTSIFRYFDILPATNKDLQATLRFHYLDAELDGRNKADLALWSSADAGTTWSFRGKDNTGKSDNVVIMSHVDRLDHFTIAGNTTNRVDKSISVTGQEWVRVFADLANDQWLLNLLSNGDKNCTIHLYDGAGKLLESRKVYLSKGVNRIYWSRARYTSGFYFMQFDDPGLKTATMIK